MDTQVLRPQVQIHIASRQFDGSTESYLLACTDLTEFWVALGRIGLGSPIGYVRYVRCAGADEVISGHAAGTFELREVLSASSPAPHPIVSLSGVSRPRPANPSAPTKARPFPLPAGQMQES